MRHRKRPRPYKTLDAQMALKNWSYMDLARELDVVPSTAHNKLTGRTPWLLDEAVKVKDLLAWDGTVEELFEKE